MGKFIVLTGLDGSGKDFVATHLQTGDTPSVLLSTPTEPFIPVRSEIDALLYKSPSLHYFFYLASVIHASTLVDEYINNGNVYCVRYLIDTVVYHRAMGIPVSLEYETSLYKIRRPDLIVFLSIDDEEMRQQRLANRGKFTVGDRLVNNDEFRNRLANEYNKLEEHFVVVNNCNRDIKDVASEIQSLI